MKVGLSADKYAFSVSGVLIDSCIIALIYKKTFGLAARENSLKENLFHREPRVRDMEEAQI